MKNDIILTNIEWELLKIFDVTGNWNSHTDIIIDELWKIRKLLLFLVKDKLSEDYELEVTETSSGHYIKKKRDEKNE